jgi:3-methyl-2-oxobutanoate hydroxymethyltransferase
MSYGAAPEAAGADAKPARVTVPALQGFKQRGEKIAMMTAYDYTFASLLERLGVDVILVGDSLGMVLQGENSTLGVSVEHMAYHTKAVARASKRALVLADLPAFSYATLERALARAQTLFAAGAHMLKLEGAGPMIAIVQELSARDIPICGHIGLTPQSLHKLGGFKVQARDPQAASKLISDARALQQAGADMLVLECVPAALAAEVSKSLVIPCIGIGAGAAVDGQVLVLHDALGLGTHRRPKFVKNFAETANPAQAIEAYVQAVKSGAFPAAEHQYD